MTFLIQEHVRWDTILLPFGPQIMFMSIGDNDLEKISMQYKLAQMVRNW